MRLVAALRETDQRYESHDPNYSITYSPKMIERLDAAERGRLLIRMPDESPTLRSNDRKHWAAKAAIVKQIRKDIGWIVRADLYMPHGVDYPVTVTLVWEVTDKRRRDSGAGSPYLKACIDGLVEAGLLAGDHHQIVMEERCRIELGETKGVRIEIEESKPVAPQPNPPEKG